MLDFLFLENQLQTRDREIPNIKLIAIEITNRLFILSKLMKMIAGTKIL